MADGADEPTPGPAESSKSPAWKWLKVLDSWFSVAKGLTLVTVLTGLLGGYFQYLNAYEEKVSVQAKDDMAAATATFLEIANAFAHAQTLQEFLVFDLEAVFRDGSDNGSNAMITNHARVVFPDYLKARTALRQSSAVLAHKAEIYIDWASDRGRDPAASRGLDMDPLSEAVLAKYHFNCDDAANLPPFAANGTSRGPKPAPKNPSACRAEKPDEKTSFVHFCGKDEEDIERPPLRIDWNSAKHHVVTMAYCFRTAHSGIETARVWASNNDLSEQKKREFKAQQENEILDTKLSLGVIRLNAFMTRAMSQLEGIRVKYRPAGFWCHVPGVRDAIDHLDNHRCTPIGTAASESS
ncbi:MAG: hypothetical protein NVSMB20_17020 [Bradyrhizobium sp.]